MSLYEYVSVHVAALIGTYSVQQFPLAVSRCFPSSYAVTFSLIIDTLWTVQFALMTLAGGLSLYVISKYKAHTLLVSFLEWTVYTHQVQDKKHTLLVLVFMSFQSIKTFANLTASLLSETDTVG